MVEQIDVKKMEKLGKNDEFVGDFAGFHKRAVTISFLSVYLHSIIMIGASKTGGSKHSVPGE